MLHKLSKTSDHNFLYIPISRSINANTYSLKLRYPLPMNPSINPLPPEYIHLFPASQRLR